MRVNWKLGLGEIYIITHMSHLFERLIHGVKHSIPRARTLVSSLNGQTIDTTQSNQERSCGVWRGFVLLRALLLSPLRQVRHTNLGFATFHERPAFVLILYPSVHVCRTRELQLCSSSSKNVQPRCKIYALYIYIKNKKKWTMKTVQEFDKNNVS